MMLGQRRFVMLAFIALATLVVVCSPGPLAGAAGPITITLAHATAETHPQHIWCVRFAELVQEKSGGRLKVQIFPNGQLGTEPQMVEGIKMGTVDMVNAGAGTVYSMWVPEMAIFDLPYIFRDYDHLYVVQDGEVGEYSRGSRKAGFKLVGWSDIGWRHFTSNSSPSRSHLI